MLWDNWPDLWQNALNACDRLGGESTPLLVRPPASEESVLSVETRVARKIPESFRSVILKFSSHVDFSWHLPENFPLPEPLRGIFSGQCFWNLDDLETLEEARRGWIQSCFPNPDDPYDKVWHNKFSFLSVPNGDMLSIDLQTADGSVVYLSHDDGEGHGYCLGRNFTDFIERWSRVGCPGSEDWQMMPFVTGREAGIDPYCENAAKWRDVFGING